MTLTELWAELKALPSTIGEPFKDTTWFRQHTAAHLVGGAALYGVGVLLGLPAFRFAVIYTIGRQGLMREAKGPREFPLYAMLWDSVTSSLAAGLVALAVRLLLSGP